MTNKIKQIVSLLTCLMIVVAVAVNRNHKIWGHDLTGEPEKTDVGVMTTLPDGTVVVNTTTLGKAYIGYAGQTPLEIYIKDGKIAKIEPLDNSETPDFFDNAKVILSQWQGKTVDEAQQLNVDAVSGATFSSRAIIGNVKAGLQYANVNVSSQSDNALSDLSAKSIAAIVVLLLGAVVPLFFKNKKYNLLQMALNVIVLGLWCGTFLSYSVLVGYVSNGLSWTDIIPIIIIITAFVYPLFGRKTYYCTHICPFGSLQDLAGKCTKSKWHMPTRLIKGLDIFRKLLWSVLMVLMLSGVAFKAMDYELFTAFIFQSASVVVIIIAVLFVLLSVFVPRPYCRFVCPTGTLLRFSQNNK